MTKQHFNQLFNYDELTRLLSELANTYPQLITLETIGQSFEGRDIRVAAVTNQKTGSAEEKPALWFDGNIHAIELVSATACLAFIHRLVTQYGSDEAITRLLDKRAFYICPRIDLDGAEAALSDNPSYVRSSLTPYPYDEDPVEGIVSRDIDGDGRLLMMRIPDNNGNWKKHINEPRLMVRREPGEEGGEYYSLLNEGDVHHLQGDIYQHAPLKTGHDLNRNFPSAVSGFDRANGCTGDAPLSEPESRAVADFITGHKNINIGIYGHTFAGVLLHPSASIPDTEMPSSDRKLYKVMGEKGAAMTGYLAFSSYQGFSAGQEVLPPGTVMDWCYEGLGIASWTIEYWGLHKQAGVDVSDHCGWYAEHPVEDDVKMLQWVDKTLDGEGYVDWYPHEHPVLGPVELGGWNVLQPFFNPPDQLIEKEINPVLDWVLWLGALTPCLALYRTDAEMLGDDVYRIELVIENTGYMPTYGTARALNKQLTRGVMAEIDLPHGCELIQGKTRENMGHLSGRNHVSANSGFAGDTTVVGGMAQRARVEWIVKAAKGTKIKLNAKQPRAGFVRAVVRCQ